MGSGEAQQHAIIALIRCFKIAIRVGWRFQGEDDPTTDGLRQGIELLHQLLGVSIEHKMCGNFDIIMTSSLNRR